jgi:hypothetical protein
VEGWEADSVAAGTAGVGWEVEEREAGAAAAARDWVVVEAGWEGEA